MPARLNGQPTFTQALPTPALRKEREGRGTHCVSGTDQIKVWATRQFAGRWAVQADLNPYRIDSSFVEAPHDIRPMPQKKYRSCDI
jgi:hypothetical protein